MADQMTEEQITTFMTHFRPYDKTNDGTISVDDLGALMRSLGNTPTEADLEQMISEVAGAEGTSSSSVETIAFPEFLVLMLKWDVTMMNNTHPDIEEGFLLECQKLDQDKSGVISEVQLRRVITALDEPISTEEINDMLHRFDAADEGAINYNDFLKFMMNE